MEKMNYNLAEIQGKILNIAIDFDQFCRANDINYFICAGTLLGGVRHQGFIPWDDDFDVAMPRADFEKFVEIWHDTDKLKLISRGGKNGHNKYGCPLKLSSSSEYVEEIGDKRRGMPVPNNYGFYIDIFPFDRYPDTLVGNICYNFLGKLYLACHLSEFNYAYRSVKERVVFSFLKLIPKSIIERIINKYINKFSNSEGGFWGYGVDTPFAKVKLKNEDIFPLLEISIREYQFLAPRNWELYLRQKFGEYTQLPPVENRVGHIENVYTSYNKLEKN